MSDEKTTCQRCGGTFQDLHPTLAVCSGCYRVLVDRGKRPSTPAKPGTKPAGDDAPKVGGKVRRK